MLLLPLFWPHGVVCLLLTLFLLCPLTSDGTVYVMGLLVFGALHRLRISHMHMTCFDHLPSMHETLGPVCSRTEWCKSTADSLKGISAATSIQRLTCAQIYDSH